MTNPTTTPTLSPRALAWLRAAQEAITFARLAAGVPSGPQRGGLPDRVIDVLRQATEPMRGKQLAKAAGVKFDSHFRRIAAQLCRDGLIVRVEGGYAFPPKQ